MACSACGRGEWDVSSKVAGFVLLAMTFVFVLGLAIGGLF